MMADDIAIKVDSVSKAFRLPHEKNSSIKSTLVNFWRPNKGYELQQALQDVSFEVKKGEFFGIVGRNGSGKSTLLKLLAGIYTPTSGQIDVNGKLTPFIELGVGFNMELTGRENVFLNGALLGFNRQEMTAMYEDIVEFAELERFMDQKLKNYSSGMQVRLAFSIAIRAESNILVLDEVLAVGDETFQQKCIGIFEKYKARKQTIILVTHEMALVERFCSRAMLLQNGRLVEAGSPRLIAQMYSDINKETYDQSRQRENEQTRGLGGAKYTSNIDIQLLDAKTQKPKVRFKYGDRLLVRLKWNRQEGRHTGVAIVKQSGEYIFGPNTYLDGKKLSGDTELDYVVELNLGPGEYFLKAGLFGDRDDDVLEFVEEGPTFIVEPQTGSAAWGGLTKLNYEWHQKGKAL